MAGGDERRLQQRAERRRQSFKISQSCQEFPWAYVNLTHLWRVSNYLGFLTFSHYYVYMECFCISFSFICTSAKKGVKQCHQKYIETCWFLMDFNPFL